jgi:predicted nuclease of predicted toxin-antitoxin system
VSDVKFYIDEDITSALARTLRARGFDAIAVSDVGRKSMDDIEQLAFAIAEQRTLMTYNIGDFRVLASQLALNQETHYGIVVSNHLPFGELLRRVVNLLRTRTAEEMINRFDWLPNYR